VPALASKRSLDLRLNIPGTSYPLLGERRAWRKRF
jgi:hypothetical protein